MAMERAPSVNETGILYQFDVPFQWKEDGKTFQIRQAIILYDLPEDCYRFDFKTDPDEPLERRRYDRWDEDAMYRLSQLAHRLRLHDEQQQHFAEPETESDPELYVPIKNHYLDTAEF